MPRRPRTITNILEKIHDRHCFMMSNGTCRRKEKAPCMSMRMLWLCLGVCFAITWIVTPVSGESVTTDTNSTLSLSTPASSSPWEDMDGMTVPASQCPHDRIIPFSQERHKKQIYRVGVLAIRGFQEAYNEFNATFMDYLSATAGQRFDPPIQFELVPLDFNLLYTDTEQGLVDFIYANPSAFSCIESEYTASSLVSQVSRRKISGKVYNLKKFGGVIMARADNDQVNHIHDLKGKVVAAASISGLGSGLMQFLTMVNAGMSFINGTYSRTY